ncbi:MAG: PPC domain-containing DNA-binding protein [Bacillota bacterium]
MKYRQGNLGRVFLARVEHGDDLLKEITDLARAERLSAAVVFMIGALKGANMVVGPRELAVPPEPVWMSFGDGREIVGMGTLYPNEKGEPALHLHGVLGRGRDSLTGCLRAETEVYLVVEMVIMELMGTGAVRKLDRDLELQVLDFQ